MVNIDELLEMNGIVEKIDENEKLMQEYLEKFAKTLYPGDKGTHFNTLMYDVDNFDSFMEMESIEMINPADIEQYKKCATEYAQLNQRLENFQEGKTLSLFDFYEYKTQFLNQLVSTQHIRDVGEDAKEFFKKLIQLYGEEELANFSYDIGLDGSEVEVDDREYEYDEDMEYDNEPFSRKHISDFIYGEEDKIIGLVKSDDLRSTLLGSKLMFMDSHDVADIRTCLEEYAEKAKEYNTYDCAFLDDLGYIDYEETLNNFGVLPISEDKNFYLYILKHKQEMQIPLEKLKQYIKDSLLKDSNFVFDMERVYSTGEYSYNPDYGYSPDIFKILAKKEATLTKLESEAEKISQAESLIDEQQKGKGK